MPAQITIRGARHDNPPDVTARLLGVLQRLVDAGNTVVLVEHILEVKAADWVIDLGPEGGAGGGRLIAEGTPEEVARVPGSYTGEGLREAVSRKAFP